MLRLLTLGTILALPLPALAQGPGSWCGGRVTAQSTRVDRVGGKVTYLVFLAYQSPMTITMTYRGNLLDRPQNRSISLPAGRSPFQVKLGDQTAGVGSTLMHMQLLEAITISC
ncbi:MAG: hypothetical protein K5Q68_03525 [Roseococcus sp.]|nr:hypothetical protein [Roseococcus sp.]